MFSTLSLPAGALLEFHCCPTALWSPDRSKCWFNSATRALFGYRDSEFRADQKLWSTRLDERDREVFTSSWQKLQSGAGKMVCRYRFMPQDVPLAIEVEESAMLLAAGPAGEFAVLSRYQTNGGPMRKLRREGRDRVPVHSLVHQIGNSLQTIRGEADLLRLFNGLPQRNFDTITQGIERIQELVAQIDGLADADTSPFPRSRAEPGALALERGADD